MKKFALVCGASGAIGQAICKKMAAEGWSLYLHYNSGAQRVADLTKQFDQHYPQQEFIPVQADFAAFDAAEQLSTQIFSLQAIIFAGGHAYYNLLDDTPAVEMEKLWRVHVQNPMLVSALLSRKLRNNGTSYILMIGSIWGEAGAAGEVVYSAVKGAQHSFVKAYAQEAAYSGIRVNAIAPGFIDTSMNQHLAEAERQAIIEDIPLQAPGQTEDVANLVAFYVSGAADYVTGQIIRVNGGWYI